MMDHIRQFDWCSSQPDVYFISEADIDNSVTEKILRNKFHDPLISSESEDEGDKKEKLNWDEIFTRTRNDKVPRTVVPGLHPVPPYPKLSALTGLQHNQLLKVLSSQNPDVLPNLFIGRPSKQDIRLFEELKETYLKEQKEFKEWAKTMWTSHHCVRALRPKPQIELVYDAEFKMDAHRMESYPKNYLLAAQIPLESANANCDLVHEKVLIKVNNSSLPQIEMPDMSNRTYIIKPYPAPEPCSKHPCRFILPSETSMTILPLTEVQRELAHYAAENGAQYVASEEALRCLVELDRPWMLPVAVCNAMTVEGNPTSVVVIDNPFSLSRESAPERSRRAYRRLLQHALVPPVEALQSVRCASPASRPLRDAPDADSDEDDDHLYIDTDDLPNTDDPNAMETDSIGENHKEDESKEKENESQEKPPDAHNTSFDNKIDFYNCTCRDSFDKPPPRSYKKWKVTNKGTNEKYSIIVHSPHIAKGPSGEVVLEALPEYQLDLGAAAPGDHAARAHALALMLRRNAAILKARIDSPTGEIVTMDTVYQEDFLKTHTEVVADVSNRLYTVVDQLQGLLPGYYVLQHEVAHGDNAILYRPAPGAAATGDALAMHFCATATGDPHEANSVRPPPVLCDALLPVHKFRRTLPCAFTPFANQLRCERARAPPRPRTRTPPAAIQLGEKVDDKRKVG